MKRHRHAPEQIVRKLRQGERLLNEGKDLAQVIRHLESSEATWNRWRNQYGGMKATEAKRLRAFEVENTRLKKLLAGNVNPDWPHRAHLIWPHPSIWRIEFENQPL